MKLKITKVATTLLIALLLFGGGMFTCYNLLNKKTESPKDINRELVEQRVQNILSGSINTANAQTPNTDININTNTNDKRTLREIHGEVRGIWIQTAYASDFPKTKYNVDEQKKEMDAILDNVVKQGFNTVFFQVRPFADAFYKSSINPWSSYLSGELGKDPKWDPLEYIIYAGHQRGLEIHAWINPFRVSSKVKKLDSFLESLPNGHIAKNEDLILRNSSTNDKGETLTEAYLNPKKAEVKEHVLNTVKELATNYTMLDGIHMDDYFYPTYYPLPEGESPDGAEANSRRAAVTDIVHSIYDTVKATNRKLTVSISPAATTKNSDTGNKAGLQNYYDLFADVETWIKNNKVDIIIPQIYFERGNDLVDFTRNSQYWNNLVEGTNVKLVIGHWIDSVKKKKVMDEIDEQIIDSRNLSNCIGDSIFGYAELSHVKDKLDSVYQ